MILHAPLALLLGLFVLSVTIAGPDTSLAIEPAAVPQYLAFLR